MTDVGMEFAEEDTMRGRYITFAVDRETYGIEIRYVTEIVGLQPISRLPEAPPHIKGVINLRGKIIPVIDMRLRFKKHTAEYTDRTCIVVVEVKELSAGLIVDEVAEVLGIGEGEIAPPPRLELGASNRYLSGIGKSKGEVKLLLNCEMLFTEEEAQELGDMQERSIAI
jgi:purine-binding chemotaxis protein CheW